MQRQKAKKPKSLIKSARPIASRKPASRSAAAAAASPVHSVNLGKHTSAYMQALLNPIGAQAADMPTMGGVNSRPIKVFARGAGSTGTGGFGFLNLSPGIGVTRDQRWGFVSNAAFAGTSMNTSAAGVDTILSNSEYTTADFPTGSAVGDSYRLVGCGARIRYFGTELNKAGLVFSLIHPEHQPTGISAAFPAGMGIADLRKFESCAATAFDREWHEIDYTGFIYPVEQEFVDSVVVPGSGATDDPVPFYNNSCMCICVEAPVPTPLPFEWEVYGIYGVVGPNVRGTRATVADPVGVSVVTAGAQHADAHSNEHHGSEEHVTAALTAVGDIAMTAMTHIGPALKTQGVVGAVKSFVVEHGPGILKRVAPFALAALL